MTEPLAALAPFHPDGHVERIHVIGGAWPAKMPSDSLTERHRCADLVLVAPTTEELATPGWVDYAVTGVSAALTVDGIAFLYFPRRFRRAALRCAAAAGLETDAAILHAPSVPAVRFLLPSNGRIFRYALRNLSSGTRWKRRLGFLAVRAPGSSWMMGRMAPNIGLLVHRRGSRRPLEWAFELARHKPVGSAIVQVSWRQPPNGAVLHCFPRSGAAPAFIVKIAWDAERADALAREADVLGALGDSARRAGVNTPATLHFQQASVGIILVQSAVPGEIAAGRLRGVATRFGPLLEQLTKWLDSWGRSTQSTGEIDREFTERNVLGPLEELSPWLREPMVYREQLVADLQSANREILPRVAAHNDLTMWNVLLQPNGTLGVVDWEAAHPRGVPMADFYYAVTDAAAAISGYRDRLAALRSCFTPGGRLRALVQSHEHALQTAFELSPAVAELCFHACWLHHGVNEARSAGAGARRPFLEIVQWMADQRQAVALTDGR
ncbi:hypothetical protein BH23GEM2_BH23GEM2_11690 [soil metagenome]